MDLKESDGWKLTSDSVVYKDEILTDTLDKILTEQKVLWQGAYHMVATHIATLSEPISNQKNGILLIFSGYSSSTAQDYNWTFHFIPKTFVNLHNGRGANFLMCDDGSFEAFGSKYLYINDDKIVGHANNNKTGTGSSGIKYKNNAFVLRYVIGL